MNGRPLQVHIADAPRTALGWVGWSWAGRPKITVIAKRAFDVDLRGALGAVHPGPLREHDEVLAGRSFVRETWPFATRLGVVVVGHAHAPTASPVAAVEVGAVMWRDGWPSAVTRVEVRAADRRTGAATTFDVLPLEPAGDSDLVPVFAGGASPFAPRSGRHGARASLLSPEQARAIAHGSLDLGSDFPQGYFDAASEAMTFDPLRGGERLSLHGLRRSRDPILVDLQFPELTATVRSAARAVELKLVTDLIVIDVDRRTLDVVSRAALTLSAGESALEVELAACSSERTGAVRTEEVAALVGRSPLPFGPPAPPAGSVEPEGTTARLRAPRELLVEVEGPAAASGPDRTQSIAWDVRARLREMVDLPFAEGSAAIPAASLSEHVDTGTAVLTPAQLAPVRALLAEGDAREPLFPGGSPRDASQPASGGIGAAFLAGWRDDGGSSERSG